jgi:hypothetical protein
MNDHTDDTRPYTAEDDEQRKTLEAMLEQGLEDHPQYNLGVFQAHPEIFIRAAKNLRKAGRRVEVNGHMISIWRS